MTGKDHLYFFDAISPIVTFESINFGIAYKASRYDRGEREDGDYINCPMSAEGYHAFIDALIAAERIDLKSFELDIDSGVQAGAHKFFEGCLPIEVLARRGRDALSFGPMRPVGLRDPRTGKRPHAVLQLRQDNLAGTLFNLVGFQTNLKFPEQRKVFRMIPGLENAEFARYGQMHRNTFGVELGQTGANNYPQYGDNLFFAGQITGVEGYAGNIATGLLAGLNVAPVLTGKSPLILPPTTMLGALCHYITHADAANFQPMKANFGILPPLSEVMKGRRNKKQRAEAYVQRALENLGKVLCEI